MEATETRTHGIPHFYKEALKALLSDEPGKGPFDLLKILTKRKADGMAGYDLTVPTLEQIRGFKRRHTKRQVDPGDEYLQVERLLADLEDDIEGLEETKAFSYGVKLGIGSESDPLIICFTSKKLLKNISLYSEHNSVFHIDGTYKLIKNRFPVIAYGRSDLNGHLHG